MKSLINFIKDHGLKVTPQRVAMIKTIKANGHINIDDLYKNIKDEFPAISLATLYKNIIQFIEKGLIREIAIPNHKTQYELKYSEHAHFICKKCNLVRDLKFGDEVELKLNISIENIENISINIYGDCCKDI